jgi:hypothetical protein
LWSTTGIEGERRQRSVTGGEEVVVVTLATMPVATINGKPPVAMGSIEYSMPLYEALDEITSLEKIFKTTNRTAEGFGSDGVKEAAQLESIQAGVNSLIAQLRETGNANKAVEKHASDLKSIIPDLDAARRRGRRTQRMLMGNDEDAPNDTTDEDEPVFDESALVFSSDEKVKHPGKCMNYGTVRWIEKHHGRRIKSQTVLEEQDMESLKRMFDHLDDDKGGTVDLAEIDQGIRLLNTFNPMANIPRDAIMQKMESVDGDNSGEIDFDEFVSAMSSGWGGNNHFYRLSDQKEAGSETLAFFEFAIAFGREKALQEVYEVNDVNWEAIKGFVELFSIKMVSSHHANDREDAIKSQGPKRMSAYQRAKSQHRTRLQIEKQRCNAAARALVAERRSAQGIDLVQLGRECISGRAQQTCDGDLMEVLAMHADPGHAPGDNASIARSFFAEANSHHPRSTLSGTLSAEWYHHGNIGSSASAKSDVSSMHRAAASLRPHTGAPVETNDQHESVGRASVRTSDDRDESKRNGVAKREVEQAKQEPGAQMMSQELEKLLLLKRKHEENPTRVNVARHQMARSVALQCRIGSTANATPVAMAASSPGGGAELEHGGDQDESSKESSENMFSPRPPRTSPRSRRQPFRSPRLSPRASAPRAPRRRGPSVRPRQSVVVDMGSVATDLTVQPPAGAQAPQPEEAPECGNNQTKGYVYRSSASGGGWRGASSEVVFPRSQLQEMRQQHSDAFSSPRADNVSVDSQSTSPRHPQLLFMQPRRRKVKVNNSSKKVDQPRSIYQSSRNPRTGREIFQAFPARHLTPYKSPVNLYLSREDPVEIVGRRDGQPTEFQPLDLTIGRAALNSSIVHVGGDEYIDTADKCVVVITPSVTSSVTGSLASPLSSFIPPISPSRRHRSSMRSVTTRET